MTQRAAYGLAVGEQLGHLEYVIDDDALMAYQQLIGEDGRYPNLMAEDCRGLLQKRIGSERLTTVWQRFEFLRPPVLGRRIQVAGWLREINEKNGLPWLRVSSFAVDEIGTEVLRSEAAFAVGNDPPSDVRAGDAPCLGRATAAGSLAQALAGDRFSLGLMTLPCAGRLQGAVTQALIPRGAEALDRNASSTSLIVGWLESRLGSDFGDDFRWGGRLSLAHHAAAHWGATLKGDAVVIDRDTGVDGAVTVRMILSVRDGLNRSVASAEAVVTMPSPRLL